ncbi:DALR domain-containing protein [Undibacterium sp.]
MFDNFNTPVAISVLLDHANEFNKTGSLIFNPRVE